MTVTRNRFSSSRAMVPLTEPTAQHSVLSVFQVPPGSEETASRSVMIRSVSTGSKCVKYTGVSDGKTGEEGRKGYGVEGKVLKSQLRLDRLGVLECAGRGRECVEKGRECVGRGREEDSLTEDLTHESILLDGVGVLHELAHGLPRLVLHHKHLLRLGHLAHHDEPKLRVSKCKKKKKKK
jgi:hypothetical protein